MLIATQLSIHIEMFQCCFDDYIILRIVGGIEKWQDRENRPIHWKCI